MASTDAGYSLGESEAFTSPRSADPFAVPDPLSDSDEETPQSTIGRASNRQRTILQHGSPSGENSSLTSAYRDADSYNDGSTLTVGGGIQDDNDDENEPPQSLLYESTADDQQSSPPRRDARNDGYFERSSHSSGMRRKSGELPIRQSGRQHAGSPFLAQGEDDEVDELINDRDLGSSSTPQPYERSRTGFNAAGRGMATNPDRLAGSVRSPSPPTPHAALAQPSPVRGRGNSKEIRSTMTSSSLSTFRSNSASPPPDLLESGSISSDLESLELGNHSRRAGRRAKLVDKNAQRPLLPVPVTSSHVVQPSTRNDESMDAGPSQDRSRASIDDPGQHAKTKSTGQRTDARDDVNGTPPAQEKKKKHRRRRHDKDGNRSRPSSRSEGQLDAVGSGIGWMKDAGRNLSDRERALWIWVNVVDLDGYLQEVRRHPNGSTAGTLTI